MVTLADGTQANLTSGGVIWGLLALPLWLPAARLALRLARRGPRS